MTLEGQTKNTTTMRPATTEAYAVIAITAPNVIVRHWALMVTAQRQAACRSAMAAR